MAIGPDYSVRPYADKYARDETPVSESDLRSIQKMADNVDSKKWGIDTRYSISSSMRLMDEVIKDTLGRQDEVEGQFQDVIDNTTDKDVISAPEIIAARDGEANLKARLDKNHNEVTAQLAQITYNVGLEEGYDSTAISNSLEVVKNGGTLLFADGDFTIDETISSEIYDDVNFIFRNATLNINAEQKLRLNSPLKQQTTLAQDGLMYSKSVVLTDVSDVDIGDIIYIESDFIAEDSWNTKSMFTSTVSDIKNYEIWLKDELHFDFLISDNARVEIYKPIKLNFDGLNLETRTNRNHSHVDIIGFQVNMRDVTQNNTEHSYAIQIRKCVNSKIDSVHVFGGTYPFLVNSCRNIRFREMHNDGGVIRHMVAPASWSADIYIDGVYGYGGLIESHPAFNVHYNNANITQADGKYWNHRAIGGSIKNSVIKQMGVFDETLLVQSLNPFDERVWDKATFEIDNVHFENIGSGSLFIRRGKNITVKNSTFPDNTVLYIGDRRNSTVIENLYLESNKGLVYIRNDNYNLKVYSDKKKHDTVFKDGFHEVDSYFNQIIRDENGNANWENKGRVVSNVEDVGKTYRIPIKIYTNTRRSTTDFTSVFLKIKLIGGILHQNLGLYDMQENVYHARVGMTNTGETGGSALFGYEPANSSGLTGIENEDLSIEVENVVKHWSRDGIDEHAICFDVVMTTNRTSPKFSLSYEIDYFGVG